eukprot:SAG11_NODE_43_length_20795_cov_11.860456_7_plen_135_part_00
MYRALPGRRADDNKRVWATGERGAAHLLLQVEERFGDILLDSLDHGVGIGLDDLRPCGEHRHEDGDHSYRSLSVRCYAYAYVRRETNQRILRFAHNRREKRCERGMRCVHNMSISKAQGGLYLSTGIRVKPSVK